MNKRPSWYRLHFPAWQILFCSLTSFFVANLRPWSNDSCWGRRNLGWPNLFQDRSPGSLGIIFPELELLSDIGIALLSCLIVTAVVFWLARIYPDSRWFKIQKTQVSLGMAFILFLGLAAILGLAIRREEHSFGWPCIFFTQYVPQHFHFCFWSLAADFCFVISFIWIFFYFS